MQNAMENLKSLIKTATTSMTSVPKPLKYLIPFYESLKLTHNKLSEKLPLKKGLAEVISVLSVAVEDAKSSYDCLFYCLKGNQRF